MNRLAHKKMTAERRAHRVRAKINGTAEQPRLAVNISNMHVTAQIVDDTSGRTLAYSTSVGQKIDGTLSDKAVWVGQDIAAKAKKTKLKKVVFDRSSGRYHGRLKALAEAARNQGLEF